MLTISALCYVSADERAVAACKLEFACDVEQCYADHCNLTAWLLLVVADEPLYASYNECIHCTCGCCGDFMYAKLNAPVWS